MHTHDKVCQKLFSKDNYNYNYDMNILKTLLNSIDSVQQHGA